MLKIIGLLIAALTVVACEQTAAEIAGTVTALVPTPLSTVTATPRALEVPTATKAPPTLGPTQLAFKTAPPPTPRPTFTPAPGGVNLVNTSYISNLYSGYPIATKADAERFFNGKRFRIDGKVSGISPGGKASGYEQIAFETLGNPRLVCNMTQGWPAGVRLGDVIRVEGTILGMMPEGYVGVEDCVFVENFGPIPTPTPLPLR